MPDFIEAGRDGAEEEHSDPIRVRPPHDAGHVETAPIWLDEFQIDRRADRISPLRYDDAGGGGGRNAAADNSDLVPAMRADRSSSIEKLREEVVRKGEPPKVDRNGVAMLNVDSGWDELRYKAAQGSFPRRGRSF